MAKCSLNLIYIVYWLIVFFFIISGFVFRTSRSGNCVLCKGDYRYKKQYEYLDGVRIKWKCIKAGKTRGACKGYVVMANGNIVNLNGHNH